MSLHKLLFRNCISSLVPSDLPVLNTDLHSCQTLSSDSTGPQTSQQSPSSSHDTSRSRSRSPQSNSSRSASASTAQHTHDSHCSTTLNISAGGASGIANDVCARCRRHDETNVSAHAAGAVECPHARCLDCELFERRNRHTHTRHVLRQWLQEGRQQAVERTIDRTEARDTSKDLKAQTNQKTRERSTESDICGESLSNTNLKEEEQMQSEDPNFNAAMSLEPVRSEASEVQSTDALVANKTALTQSNSCLESVETLTNISSEQHSNSDTGISTQSSEDHQNAVSDISLQSTESVCSQGQQWQKSNSNERLVQNGVQVPLTTPSPMTSPQAVSLAMLTGQVQNQHALPMLRFRYNAVPSWDQHTLIKLPVPMSTPQDQEPNSVPHPPCAPLNAVPARLPSPPPLYRFADMDLSRAHNPVEPTAQLTNWPAIPTRGTTASRNNRPVHNENLSSGPIRASTNWNAPVPRSPQVAALLPAGEPPLSAGRSTASQKPQVLPYQPPHDVPVNSVRREQWPKTPGATVLGANGVRATVGREPVMWLGEHPASNEKYLYFCVPYAEVQQPTRLPQPPLLTPHLQISNSTSIGSAAPTTSLLSPQSLQPTRKLDQITRKQPILIHDDDSDNELQDFGAQAPTNREICATSIQSVTTSLFNAPPAAAAAVPAANTVHKLKRARIEAKSPEAPQSKRSRGPISPITSTLSPLFPLPQLPPLSHVATAVTAAQKYPYLHASLTNDASAAVSSQLPTCSSAPSSVSNGMQIRATAPVIDADYVSPRLARMLGVREPNSIPRPSPTLQQSPPPVSTHMSTQRPTEPPMRVSSATSGAPNGAQVPDMPKRTSATLCFRTECESVAPEQTSSQGPSTQSLAPKLEMQSTRAHKERAASASTAASVASVTQSQAVTSPQHIASICYAYARKLISETRAHIDSERRTTLSANPQAASGKQHNW